MEEIEVGEYIRTKTGKIYKIDKIDKCPICKEKEYINIEIKGDLHFENTYHKKDIIKHSSNIIDLIEVGDYVNGYKVTLIYEDVEKFVQCDYPVESGCTHHYKFYNRAIKSICTREQFESVQYKLDN